MTLIWPTVLELPSSLIFESHITKLRWQPRSTMHLHSYPPEFRDDIPVMEAVSTCMFCLKWIHGHLIDTTCILFALTHQNSIIMKLKTGKQFSAQKQPVYLTLRCFRQPTLYKWQSIYYPVYCGITEMESVNNQSVNGLYGSLSTSHPLCLCCEKDELITPVYAACLFRV